MLFRIWRNGIVTVTAPRMTGGDALDAHPTATKRSPFFDGLNGIITAGWCITTICPQQWGNKPLIEFHWKDEYIIDVLHHLFHVGLTLHKGVPPII